MIEPSPQHLGFAPTQNTLRKLGADLRWLLDKNRVDAEKSYAIIVVETVAERDRLIAAFHTNFDAASMSRSVKSPHQVTIHGVRVAVTVKEETA